MKKLRSLGVFCGSRVGVNPAHLEAAEALGRAVARRGIDLVYGGGGIGLMARVAQTAIANGGRVTGVIPEFLVKYEVGDVPGVEVHEVASMHQRKALMFEKSDAFAVLPGGLGTLDEAIEVITWKQLQQHRKPVILINVDGYWEPFLTLIERVVEGGFGHHKITELYSVVDTVEQVFDAIAVAPEPDQEVLTSHL